MKPLNAMTARILRLTPLALATTVLVACGGGSSGGTSPTGTIAGTAAIGVPMANAQVQFACKNGGTTVTADANGAYSATFPFDSPCEIVASNSTTTLHSFAAHAGTYNVSPLTELLMVYLAAQLNTNLSGLLGGITSNATYQSGLTNSTAIANAQTGVATLIKNVYGVTLSTTSFLTVSFTPGTPADTDLDTLLTKGALLSNGQPAASLVTSTTAAGTSAGPITPPGGAVGATGGTGGTGGTGTGTP